MNLQLNSLWTNWSESKLRQFEQCPLAFRLSYIDKIEVPQSENKVFGSTIHYLLKRFFDLKNGYKSAESFTNSFVGFYLGVKKGEHGPNGYWERPILLRQRSKEDYIGLGIALLKKFYEENQPYRDGTYPKPHILEKQLKFRHHGFWLTAKLDRVQPSEAGDIIYDYKTGLDNRSEIELLFDLQFSFYSLAYLKMFGKQPAKIALWFLKTDGSKIVELPTRSPQHYIDLAGKIEEAARFVKAALIPEHTTCLAQQTYHYFCFPRIPQPNFYRIVGPHCRFCDYDFICAKYQTVDTFRSEQIKQELIRIKPTAQTIQLTLPLEIKKTKKVKK